MAIVFMLGCGPKSKPRVDTSTPTFTVNNVKFYIDTRHDTNSIDLMRTAARFLILAHETSHGPTTAHVVVHGPGIRFINGPQRAGVRSWSYGSTIHCTAGSFRELPQLYRELSKVQRQDHYMQGGGRFFWPRVIAAERFLERRIRRSRGG